MAAEPTWRQTLQASSGIARQSTLVGRTCTKRELAEAVAAGQLERVRRSWLALPATDPLLVAAARAGVVIGCVTRARRLGLWVLDEGDLPHVCAPPASGGVRVARDGETDAPRAVVHWFAPVMPRPPHTLEDGIENTLVAVAQCVPFDNALVIWDSALNKRLVDRDVLARLPLPASARAVLAEATPFADSGLETIVPRRLRWLRLRIVPQAWVLGHRVDFLIGDRLVLQIDGGHHVGAQRDEDIRHDAKLLLHGYHVIRVSYQMIIGDWPAVQKLIMEAVAQNLHRSR
ncbi:endonuclease domain-containing protein [Microbacterium kyungheense]|uniref:Very-short-patch-repair endonuclease n=1 Tax=Microbacterium kyungheense TaxID=1263636 RepID=A0A543EAG4_9MICO|nr:DUF559 domain-containing protein [Microbacterium kyungheense]TQM18558.1 very-short-patch-repair endonuclease [Microbacterium kyungheense]